MGLKIINSEYLDLLKTQIAEKDLDIRRLRAEIASAKIVPQPIPVMDIASSRYGDSVVAASVVGPLDWQGELNSLIQEEEEKQNGL